MSGLRCAIYARFSSDRQSPTSIDDQVRKCCQHAAQKDWQVLEEHIYTDEAISGTTMERDGLKKLLAAASSPLHPFDCILIDDSSRLTRRLADCLELVERLEYSGIRIVAVSQGVDTEHPEAELLMGFHGLVDSLYSRELAQKTHRGLEGRALKGLATGGRCFGYKTVGEQARLEVVDSEAKIINRIYSMHAAGLSLKRIARGLNEDRVQSPQPQKGRLSRSWCTSSVQTILHNERYRGKLFWNKTQKIRNPTTGRRIQRARPKSEWVISEAPHLRIVSEELWSKVQQRFATVRRLWGRDGGPGLLGQQRQVYLFSGLLKCGQCGGSITLVSGRWRTEAQQYGCSMYHQRGETVCSNRRTIRRDELEAQLLQGLQEKVLQGDTIDYIIARLASEMIRRFEISDDEMVGLRARKQELECEINHLVDAIANGEQSKALTSAIADRERELRTVTIKLIEPHSKSVQVKVDELRTFVLSRLADLRALLSRPHNVHEARASLAECVGKLTLVPDDSGGYMAKGGIDFVGDTELRVECAEGQNRTAYAGLFRAALYR
jgi:site-specific DNA recombinase